MAASLLLQALIAKRRTMSPQARSRRQKARPISWLYPAAQERTYARQITAWMMGLVGKVTDYLRQYGEDVLKGDSAAHADAGPGARFRTLFATLQGWLAAAFPDPDAAEKPTAILMGLGQTAGFVNRFNRVQWQKALKHVLGFEFDAPEQWWPGLRDQWALRNYQLIKSQAQSYIGTVNDLVEKAVTNGWSYKTLMEDLLRTNTRMSVTKAKLLARDQIGKLNEQITQARQEEAGVNWYTWATARDERVRGRPGGRYPDAVPSHWVMDGLLCRWDDATVCSYDGGKTWVPRPANAPMAHPGQEIQCRCTALAYLDELVGLADNTLRQTGGY